MLDKKQEKDLRRLALEIRIGTVEAIKSRGFGHIGGSLKKECPAISSFKLVSKRHPSCQRSALPKRARSHVNARRLRAVAVFWTR